MAAIEEKYRPARPANVSADQFKQDPTVGKLQIERFNDVYKHYDAEIVQERGRGDRYAICYTLSKTPPNAEVESIEEWCTVYQENVWINGEIIWRGRTIPRTNVVPVPAQRGDYLDLDGDRVFAEPYYYSPPSTASETERNRTR